MADAFILRAGGGGGLSVNAAVLHVTAPLGSTVTIAKGSVSKSRGPEKAHTNAEDEAMADYYFSISPANYGTWTVTAALDDDTTSAEVSVSTNQQYDAELLYKVYIFKSGKGLSAAYEVEAKGAAIKFGTDSIVCTEKTGFVLSPRVDATKFTKLYCDIKVNSTDSTTYHPTFGLSSSTSLPTNSGNDAKFLVKKDIGKTDRAVFALDISEVNEEAYVKVTCFYSNWEMYNLWFE